MDATRILSQRLITIAAVSLSISLTCGCATHPAASPTKLDQRTEATATLAEQVLPTPTNVPSPDPYTIDLGCVGCHTDKAKLISTASQVEDEKPESSGEG